MTRIQVVIVGGGYAGTMAANRLRQHPSVDVTLVNPRPQFVERIRLHQHVAGNYRADRDYRDLLGDGVRLLVDSAERIDAADRRIQLASGTVLRYDYLIYAVGSTGAITTAVPGAAQFAHSVSEFESAERLLAQLDELAPDAPVTVVGGGLTGIEAAAELAGRGRTVTLVCGGTLGPSLNESGRRSVAKALRKLGVELLEAAAVVAVRPDAVVLHDARVLPSALTVWTAGFGVPELAAVSGLATDALGRLLTDETLTSVDNPWIVAAGDAAAPSGRPLRMSCQAAIPLGAQAADTVLARIAGTSPTALDQAFTGQCISVGRSYATVQLARRDDTPVKAYLGGRLAAAVKEAICKATVWGIRREGAKPGSYRWLKGGTRTAQIAQGQAEQEAAV
ncbi:NAD(P)/FAD-dependent oxidoreductase [Mycolicibacter sinensis]|uniref:Pyridine nucleotide-disulfide oxidoreductase n=1 Tax=Mycolicibacter sinensis (strain JDM601) TaxID=875328 RepID=A0A1A2XTW1_MYCSD|nr:FAD-dependent oxidoreductase [Mycolicibacter sinensis]OBH21190.1 pyridine nucleotide-disulfide oxidoreductase [Mycolicibacter sinensis]OBI28522.1 pyridine nucleotide-disulfide oxidoreductase [Mycolicibacter sinensis]